MYSRWLLLLLVVCVVSVLLFADAMDDDDRSNEGDRKDLWKKRQERKDAKEKKDKEVKKEDPWESDEEEEPGLNVRRVDGSIARARFVEPVLREGWVERAAAEGREERDRMMREGADVGTVRTLARNGWAQALADIRAGNEVKVSEEAVEHMDRGACRIRREDRGRGLARHYPREEGSEQMEEMPGDMEKARLDLARFEAQRAYEQQVALEGIRMRAEMDAGFGQQRALWQTIERGSDGVIDVVNISWRPEEGEVILGDEVLEVANKEFEEWAAAGYRECVDGLGWDKQKESKPKKEVREEDWNVELRNERGRRTVRKVETEKERRDRQIELMVAQELSMIREQDRQRTLAREAEYRQEDQASWAEARASERRGQGAIGARGQGERYRGNWFERDIERAREESETEAGSMEWMEERRARREETIRNWRVWDELELAYEIAEAERQERDRSEESE